VLLKHRQGEQMKKLTEKIAARIAPVKRERKKPAGHGVDPSINRNLGREERKRARAAAPGAQKAATRTRSIEKTSRSNQFTKRMKGLSGQRKPPQASYQEKPEDQHIAYRHKHWTQKGWQHLRS